MLRKWFYFKFAFNCILHILVIIKKLAYFGNGHILQTAIYYERPYTTNGHILQSAIYYKRPYISNYHILQKVIYCKRPDVINRSYITKSYTRGHTLKMGYSF